MFSPNQKDLNLTANLQLLIYNPYIFFPLQKFFVQFLELKIKNILP